MQHLCHAGEKQLHRLVVHAALGQYLQCLGQCVPCLVGGIALCGGGIHLCLHACGCCAQRVVERDAGLYAVKREIALQQPAVAGHRVLCGLGLGAVGGQSCEVAFVEGAPCGCQQVGLAVDALPHCLLRLGVFVAEDDLDVRHAEAFVLCQRIACVHSVTMPYALCA